MIENDIHVADRRNELCSNLMHLTATASICGDQRVIRRVISSPAKEGNRWSPNRGVRSEPGGRRCCQSSLVANLRHPPSPSKIAPALALQRARYLRRFEFDVRTSIDDIDQRPPPRCPRKSSRSPALPSALTRATYVHPEIHHRMRSEKDEGGKILGERETWIKGLEERNTG